MPDPTVVGMLGAAMLLAVTGIGVWLGARTAAANHEVLAARAEDARDYPRGAEARVANRYAQQRFRA